MVGWVKRDIGTIYVEFDYFNVPQQSEKALKLANPTRSVADRRLNPAYDLLFRPTKWIPPFPLYLHIGVARSLDRYSWHST